MLLCDLFGEMLQVAGEQGSCDERTMTRKVGVKCGLTYNSSAGKGIYRHDAEGSDDMPVRASVFL